MIDISDNEDELLIELDENGTETGRGIKRSEAHRLGICHQALSLIVHNDQNKILLQKRSLNKIKNAGMWDTSVSGHCQFGETAPETISREALEEIGLKLNIQKLHLLAHFHHKETIKKDFIENQYFDIYLAQSDAEIKNVHNAEVEEIRWFSLDEIKEMMKTYEKLACKPQVFDALIKYFEN